ncbi:MAG: hypothetical protein HOY71_20650, partial [Nonomuraea sp.]|nr:hypothetical protein [Nonomuraea sp.]
MSRSSTSRRVVAVLAASLGLSLAPVAGPAQATTERAPVVTRAALDPALVAGRGARVAF